jgi:hypothetical protein
LTKKEKIFKWDGHKVTGMAYRVDFPRRDFGESSFPYLIASRKRLDVVVTNSSMDENGWEQEEFGISFDDLISEFIKIYDDPSDFLVVSDRKDPEYMISHLRAAISKLEKVVEKLNKRPRR